jgi:hypothetical protein
MAIPKILGAQRDFSAGELDKSAKRADENPVVKDGGRQMVNWRVLSPRSLQNRPGRSALFLASGRTEEVTMPGGAVFFLNFSIGSLKVFNYAGVQVFSAATMQLVPGGGAVSIPWLNLGRITWAQINYSIYLAFADGFPSNVPQVLTYNPTGATWLLAPFAETVTYGGQKRTMFYRVSPQNITLLPSAVTGNITITFSSAVLNAGMIGTRLRYCGRELTITGVSSGTAGTATVNQPLPPGQTLSYTTLTGTINIGDVVLGGTTGAEGIVVATSSQQTLLFVSPFNYISPSIHVGDTVTQAVPAAASGVVTGNSYYFDQTFYYVWLTVTVPVAGPFFVAVGGGGGNITGPNGSFGAQTATASGVTQITVQLIPTGAGDVSKIIQFAGAETVAGPSGSFALTANAVVAPQAVSVWDDEVMNLFRGYPASVFADQSRLGFTNFNDVPAGIAWSAIGLPTDLYVGALPSDAIFELAPDNSQVFYVIAGMESSEFVFTDRAIYYIPITPAVPLEPGATAFNKLSDYGCLPDVQPRRAEQSIIYIKAGGTQVGAVQAPGAYYRPYVVDHISEMHSHLFIDHGLPIAIAVPTGPTQFAETYIYVVLASGSIVTGKYAMRQGLIEPGAEGKPAIGWMPWTGAGLVKWVAARQSDVIFTRSYGTVSVVERLDDNQYLDGALLVNVLPTPFIPPGGKGPLFVFPGPNTSVFLIDLGTRFMGTYQVDSNGFLVPQGIAGENLGSHLLVAGQDWTAIFEPWTPEAPPGQSQRQRLLKRRICYAAVRVTNSTGFVMARLFAGPLTPTSPALGTIMNTRRIDTWNQDDDPTQPAPQREDAFRWRPLGRSFDPRFAVIKDTPGPLLINEVTMEVTV